jgi:MFS family permease
MVTFSIIWIGQLFSILGSGLTSFGLGVWIYEETGSVTLFAVNLLVWILPNIAFSPLAGVIADRWDRRLVMIFSNTGAGLSSLFVAIVLLTGKLEVWHVYLATFFNSAFGAFQWPAYSAATSQLVPKEHLGRAGGMTQIGEAISNMATPAIAGALFVSAGLKSILLIDVATYLAALTTLIAVRFPPVTKQSEAEQEGLEKKTPFLKEAFYGWIFIRQRTGLLGLLLIFAVMNFLVNVAFTVFNPLLLDMASPDLLGYVGSIGGLGMLFGTLSMIIWVGPKRRIFGIFAAEVGIGLSTFFIGLRPSIALISIGNFGWLLAAPVSQACSQAIWQTKVAPEVQGRVFSIRRMIAFSVIPIAYLVAGPLAEKVFEPLMAAGGKLAPLLGPWIGQGEGRGIGLMFIVTGMIYVALASLIVLNPRIRRVELEISDTAGVKA